MLFINYNLVLKYMDTENIFNSKLGYETESEALEQLHEIEQKGGENNNNRPTGGFPPIYECLVMEEQNKNRVYSTMNTAVSIKSILETNRKVEPFF